MNSKDPKRNLECGFQDKFLEQIGGKKRKTTIEEAFERTLFPEEEDGEDERDEPEERWL
jgi:hypothetical protein